MNDENPKRSLDECLEQLHREKERLEYLVGEITTTFQRLDREWRETLEQLEIVEQRLSVIDQNRPQPSIRYPEWAKRILRRTSYRKDVDDHEQP